MIERFHDLSRPPNTEKPIKHEVVYHIFTTGCPCYACASPLPPKKLEVVRNEIGYLLEAALLVGLIVIMLLHFIWFQKRIHENSDS